MHPTQRGVKRAVAGCRGRKDPERDGTAHDHHAGQTRPEFAYDVLGRSSQAAWVDGRPQGETMSKFKIKVARIEAAGGKGADSQVCITFAITRRSVGFQVPIHLKVGDY